MSASLFVRLVDFESRIASGLNTVVFDFILFYLLLFGIARFLKWYHLRVLYDKRRCLQLQNLEAFGINTGVVARSNLGYVMMVVVCVYTLAAIISGFGINGATVDVHDVFEDVEVLLPALGIRDRSISKYGTAFRDSKLGNMYFSAIRCSDVDGKGLSMPLVSIPGENETKLECADQREVLLDTDMTVVREPEAQVRIRPCVFGKWNGVYRLPAENGGPPDGTRVGFLYSGGDCDSNLNMTCAIGARYGCAAKVKIDKIYLCVGRAKPIQE
ncbi:unnamed protein product [Agarophyton chilense]